MSKVYEYFKRELEQHDCSEPISECCEVPPAYEISDGIGYCSKCGRGTGFISG